MYHSNITVWDLVLEGPGQAGAAQVIGYLCRDGDAQGHVGLGWAGLKWDSWAHGQSGERPQGQLVRGSKAY